MSFGPACERCGCCSYEGSTDGPVKCPFCKKFKRRGSREEIVAVLKEAEHALYAATGFIIGQSIASKESILKWIRETVERINDV